METDEQKAVAEIGTPLTKICRAIATLPNCYEEEARDILASLLVRFSPRTQAGKVLLDCHEELESIIETRES